MFSLGCCHIVGRGIRFSTNMELVALTVSHTCSAPKDCVNPDVLGFAITYDLLNMIS